MWSPKFSNPGIRVRVPQKTRTPHPCTRPLAMSLLVVLDKCLASAVRRSRLAVLMLQNARS